MDRKDFQMLMKQAIKKFDGKCGKETQKEIDEMKTHVSFFRALDTELQRKEIAKADAKKIVEKFNELGISFVELNKETALKFH